MQCAGQRPQHALGNSAEVPAYHPSVVRRAHPGELRDLLVAQPGNPAVTAEGAPAIASVDPSLRKRVGLAAGCDSRHSGRPECPARTVMPLLLPALAFDRFRSLQPGAWDRAEPGQDADGPDLLLPRHPPAPHRPQLPAAALYRDVMTGTDKEHLVTNIVSHVKAGVKARGNAAGYRVLGERAPRPGRSGRQAAERKLTAGCPPIHPARSSIRSPSLASRRNNQRCPSASPTGHWGASSP